MDHQLSLFDISESIPLVLTRESENFDSNVSSESAFSIVLFDSLFCITFIPPGETKPNYLRNEFGVKIGFLSKARARQYLIYTYDLAVTEVQN